MRADWGCFCGVGGFVCAVWLSGFVWGRVPGGVSGGCGGDLAVGGAGVAARPESDGLLIIIADDRGCQRL